jgi:large subunit ribosomal protein L20
MTRVKGGTTKLARRKKVLKAAKGYFGSKHRIYRTAKEQLMTSRLYAFRDRRNKKRDFRKLWITRINAACRDNNISYSRFIEGLTKAGVGINRKMLSEIAINDPKLFTSLVQISKDGKNGVITKQEPKVEKAVKAMKAEPKEEVKKAVKKETKTDLSDLTVAELKAMAKDKGIEGYSKLKKDELIKVLK